MTPAEAAAVLRISVDSSAEAIERAYRSRARLTHPDLLTGATAADRTNSAAQFSRAVEARSVLMRYSADRAAHNPETVFVEPHASAHFDTPRMAPAINRWVFSTWAALLVVAVSLSFLGGPLPLSLPDLFLRLVPLSASALAYAVSGRRFFLMVLVVMGIATGVVTVVFASFGSLLAFQVLAVPVIGLASIGRRRQRGIHF
ncbi:MAG TPA: J domain-containing protein [Glaciihabitans sp.]|nr:J domain-containing protein [Glaciihabitans sp.]